MGGLEHYRMRMDPAIQKLGNTTSNRHQYFRWTPRTSALSFVFLLVIPLSLGVVGYKTDGRWNLRAKRKGDMVSEY